MSPKFLLGCGLVILGSVLGAASTASALTWYVDASASGPAQNGQAWCTAFVQVQDALAVAAVGDEIRVANGTYRPDRGAGQTLGNRNSTFRLRRGVALRGGYAGCGAVDPDGRDFVAFETILSGDLNGDDGANFTNNVENAYHVVTNDDPTTTNSTVLDGFTIVGGNANGTLAAKTDQGSGIHNFNGVNPFTGKPLVQNCTLKNNWAGNHGAFNDHGGATLINCEFRDNHAGMWGGGLYIHDSLPSIVTDCRFIHNDTDGTSGGGGGAVHEGQATFTNCLFSGNSSKNHGGGFYNHGGGHPVLNGCIFLGNTAIEQGGGMYNNQSSATLSGCRFEANEANGFYPETPGSTGHTGSAGAVYNHISTASFTNCAFIDNFGRRYGGAVSVQNGASTFTNCSFYGNVSHRVAGGVNVQGGGQATMIRCDFVNNSSIQGGGAIYSVTQPNLLIVNSRFFGNSTQNNGGAVFAMAGLVTVVNSLFSGNSAGQNGGAINFIVPNGGLPPWSGTLYVANSTFKGNSAATGRSLAFITDDLALSGDGFIRNSILWDGPGALADLDGDSVSVSHCDISGGWAGTDNFDLDPLFLDADGADQITGTDDDDLRLGTGSPCFDTGDISMLHADLADLDQDGDLLEPTPRDVTDGPRVVSAAPDLGAHEQVDCNGNGVPDDQDLASGTSSDCNANSAPDECEPDCNASGVPDDCDVTAGTSPDCNVDLVPDECEPDCNANGIPDECDVASGASMDCNANAVPDECDVVAGFADCNGNGVLDACVGLETDCNANTVPDECDIAGASSTDCDGDGVPDECGGDCNANGVADVCDLSGGTSADVNANGVPDECETLKNRYLSFVPTAALMPAAHRVRFVSGAYSAAPAAILGWIGPPDAKGNAKVVASPYFSLSWLDVVQVGDCEIMPAAVYEVSSTTDGSTLTPPVTLRTVSQPLSKFWGDVAGFNNGSEWTPPNLLTNVNDILAVLAYINNAAVKPEFQRANLQAVSSNDPCLNAFVNTADVLILVKAVAGDAYPFTTNPANCPVCP